VRDPAKFHRKYRGTDLVFGLGAWGLGLRIEDLGRQAGIHATAHMFRHTCATWRVLQGCDASSLMQIMGWASPEMMGVHITLGVAQLQTRAMATSPLNGFQLKPAQPRPPIRQRILPPKREGIMVR